MNCQDCGQPGADYFAVRRAWLCLPCMIRRMSVVGSEPEPPVTAARAKKVIEPERELVGDHWAQWR